jgi:hypothetical protein
MSRKELKMAKKGKFVKEDDQFRVPFSRIAMVDKMPLISFPANW